MPDRGRARDELPDATQGARALRERLQNQASDRAGERGTAARDDGREADRAQGATTAGNAAEADVGRRTGRIELPAVPTVTRPSTRAVDRPGRLEREPANRAVENALARFAGLRAAAEGPETNAGRAAQTGTAQMSTEDALRTRGLNREADASIRLLAARNARTAEAGTTDARSAEDRATGATAISRANTTPEIRANLQADASEIERGLRTDADFQARENARTTAETSEAAAQRRRTETVSANEQHVRDLRSEAQGLQRELRNTQRQIRTLQNESARAQTGISDAPARAAANLANRVDVLT